MRILLSVASLDAVDGGPSNAVICIARELAKLSHEVEVITPVTTGEARPDAMHHAVASGVRFIEVATSRKTRWRFSIGLAVELVRAVRRAQAVSIHGFYQFPSFFTYLLCRLYRRPFVLQPHGVLEPYQQRESSIVKSIYMMLGGASCVRSCKSINVASVSEKTNILTQFPNARVNVVGMGVPKVQEDLSDQLSNIRGGGHSRDSNFRVLFLSRVARKKRVDLLLDALARVDSNSWALSIAGTGAPSDIEPLLSQIDRLNLGPRVLWLGHVEKEEKVRAYRSADIFILPSDNENFGQAVTEAMAYGLPVITTSGVGACVHVQKAGAGLVVPAGNVKELADAIGHLIGKPAELEQMGKRARLYVQSELTWEAVAERVVTSFSGEGAQGIFGVSASGQDATD